MAKHVIVGCAGLPHGVGWPRYFLRLPYLETAALLQSPVRASVLRRWREAAGHERAFGVVAPAIVTHMPGPRGFGPRGWPVPAGRINEVGGFRNSEIVHQGVEALVAAAETLEAGVVIFRTPPDFSPSQTNRDAMRHFFAEQANAERFAGRSRVWVPSGLWEPPAAYALARDLGILCGLDPLGGDPERRHAPFWASLSGDDVYLVVSGLGRGRRRTSNDHLEQIAEIALRHDRAWVVFSTVEPFPDAIRLTKMVAGTATDTDDLDASDSDRPDDEDALVDPSE
ncbi:MAG: DUF72 domain-containing protein [Kofleriaceae bacterium]|nr:MAG: DUF72 domain-containing protein [Kofleriaceae bacterium]MBZ0235845.1 DUF72 domain-containing protein [Kofleriaceae bacterium]